MKNFVQAKSKVDVALSIARNQWALSIIRNPNSSNPEHAFLILEGIEGTEIVIRKYDLYMDQNRGGYSVIVEKSVRGTPSEVDKAYQTLVSKDYANAKLYYLSWNITDNQAEKLMKEIEADKANPPRYNISGNHAISGQSNSGSSAKGHSCFSWARAKINNIGDKDIQVSVKIEDYIAAATSRHIGPKEEQHPCMIM